MTDSNSTNSPDTPKRKRNYSHDDAMADLEYLRLAPSSFAADRIAAYIAALEESNHRISGKCAAIMHADEEDQRTIDSLRAENAELRKQVVVDASRSAVVSGDTWSTVS